MVHCYAWYTVSERRGTSPLPPFKGGGKSKAKRWGKRHRISAEGCKPDVTIVVHSHVHYYINGKRRTVYRVIWVKEK